MKRYTLNQALDEAYTTNVCIGYKLPHSNQKKRYNSKECMGEFYTPQSNSKSLILYTECICLKCKKEVRDIEDLLAEA